MFLTISSEYADVPDAVGSRRFPSRFQTIVMKIPDVIVTVFLRYQRWTFQTIFIEFTDAQENPENFDGDSEFDGNDVSDVGSSSRLRWFRFRSV